MDKLTYVVLHMSVCVVLHMNSLRVCGIAYERVRGVAYEHVRSVAYEWSVVLPEVLSVELAVGEQFLTVLEPPAHSTLKAFHLIIYSRY